MPGHLTSHGLSLSPPAKVTGAEVSPTDSETTMYRSEDNLIEVPRTTSAPARRREKAERESYN